MQVAKTERPIDFDRPTLTFIPGFFSIHLFLSPLSAFSLSTTDGGICEIGQRAHCHFRAFNLPNSCAIRGSRYVRTADTFCDQNAALTSHVYTVPDRILRTGIAFLVDAVPHPASGQSLGTGAASATLGSDGASPHENG